MSPHPIFLYKSINFFTQSDQRVDQHQECEDDSESNDARSHPIIGPGSERFLIIPMAEARGGQGECSDTQDNMNELEDGFWNEPL